MEVSVPKFTSILNILIVSFVYNYVEMTIPTSQWDVTCRQLLMVKFIIKFFWTHHIMKLIYSHLWNNLCIPLNIVSSSWKLHIQPFYCMHFAL